MVQLASPVHSRRSQGAGIIFVTFILAIYLAKDSDIIATTIADASLAVCLCLVCLIVGLGLQGFRSPGDNIWFIRHGFGTTPTSQRLCFLSIQVEHQSIMPKLAPRGANAFLFFVCSSKRR